MKTPLLLFFLFCLVSQAQTTQTITIDWGFNSTPTASGNANTARTIEVGDTVEWNWYASGSHNVVSDGGTESFDSGATTSNPGVNFTYTFNQIGSTNFICEPHSSIMFGTITVVAEGTLSIKESRFNSFTIKNPIDAVLEIKLPNHFTSAVLELHNIIGKSVLQRNIIKDRSNINIDFLPKGLYIARLKYNDKIFIKKLVKN